MGLVLGIGQTRPQMPYDYYYGIEWDVTVSNPKVTRIGKNELHASLPVQSLMRRCILNDNGEVVYYLDPNDSTLTDTGAPAKLDGTDGQVMVEIPEFYVRFEEDRNKRRAMISTFALPGFHRWERVYVGAYEATLQRSTRKMCSVMNSSVDYRGGFNSATNDSNYNTLLGRPMTYDVDRKFARNRGSVNWNIYTYQAHKELAWLFAIEYATLNSEDPFNAALDSNGFRQGGLGVGINTYRYFPCVPIGLTNSLGNRSGYVEYNAPNSNDGSVAPTQLKIHSYRGIELPFGHLWKQIDGILTITKSNTDGGLTECRICKSKSDFGDESKYQALTTMPAKSGFVKDIAFGDDGDIVPTIVGGSSTTFFCDYYNAKTAGASELRNHSIIIGDLFSPNTGFFSFPQQWDANRKGTRLCYLPDSQND